MKVPAIGADIERRNLVTKGQLISKRLLGVVVSTKKPTKIF